MKCFCVNVNKQTVHVIVILAWKPFQIQEIKPCNLQKVNSSIDFKQISHIDRVSHFCKSKAQKCWASRFYKFQFIKSSDKIYPDIQCSFVFCFCHAGVVHLFNCDMIADLNKTDYRYRFGSQQLQYYMVYSCILKCSAIYIWMSSIWRVYVGIVLEIVCLSQKIVIILQVLFYIQSY